MLSNKMAPVCWGWSCSGGREVWVVVGGFGRVWVLSVVKYLHEALSY
jgi:hypothetical protein